VVTFDSKLPGTLARQWDSDERWREIPPTSFDGITDVIVVAAHPDDESLGAGGLIAMAAASGIRIRVVTVTDGAASHPGIDDAGALAERRRHETIAAVTLLAPDAQFVFAEIADGAVRENRERTKELLALEIATAPVTTLLVCPWRGDGHRDHRIVGEVCAELAASSGLRLLEYPIWLWHWSSPDEAATPWDRFVSLPLSPAAVIAKQRAIASHESQIAPLHPGESAVLHPLFLRNFDRDSEIFVATPDAGSARFVDTRVPSTMSAEYFDATYARHADPWGFETRWYERRKRAITLAALPEERFGTVLEIGCSLGLLTVGLAALADTVLAVDISQAAVDAATARTSELRGVTVEKRDVSTDWPEGTFDLIVLSEVGYYFDPPTLAAVLDRMESSLAPGGSIVLCHWRHFVRDYPLSGDEVHAQMLSRPKLVRLVSHREEDFVLEVFSPDGRSVAARTGLTS
jgi:LmbE family N-acetylglucosaminyl deacetylase/protein-L-isoaspartate O-methyltransferase